MSTSAYAGLDPCVHCGFCLQACPTFVATGDEADSPRGRIVLMQQLRRGNLALTDEQLARHIDLCLGCRACETACPAGVVYGPALEETRARLSTVRPAPAAARAALAWISEPYLRRPLLALARLVRPVARWFAGSSSLRFTAGMLASTRSWKNGATQTNRALHPRGGPEIVVFEGCVMEGLFGHVNRATGRVLEANGYKTVQVGDQQCCGALHAHAGAEMGARELARRNIRAFGSQPEAKIAVNSAGCGAMLKDYGRLLQDDPVAQDAAAFADRVFDVTELLAPHGPREGAPMNLSVAYDAPCHLQHAQKVVADSEALFNAIPGLEMIPHHEADVCCGGAGLYSMVEREMSREVLDRKIESVLDLDADIVATGNPGCIMQIGAGLLATKSDVRVVHPVELLDTSYRNAGFYE